MAAPTKKAAGKKKTKKKKKPQYRNQTAGGGEGEKIPTPNELMRAMASQENIERFQKHFSEVEHAADKRGEISHKLSYSRNQLVDRRFNRRVITFMESFARLEPQHRQGAAITLYVAALALGRTAQKDLFIGGLMPELEELDKLEQQAQEDDEGETPETEGEESGDDGGGEPVPAAAQGIPDNQVPSLEDKPSLSDEEIRELCDDHGVKWDPNDPGGTLKRLDEKLQSQRGGAPAH